MIPSLSTHTHTHRVDRAGSHTQGHTQYTGHWNTVVHTHTDRDTNRPPMTLLGDFIDQLSHVTQPYIAQMGVVFDSAAASADVLRSV